MLGVVLALLYGADARAHVYGAQGATTKRALKVALDIVEPECPHVSIKRDDFDRPGLRGKAFECRSGMGRVFLSREVRSFRSTCTLLTHELYHVEGWRALQGEEYVTTLGRVDNRHHESRRSVMHPVADPPRVCRR